MYTTYRLVLYFFIVAISHNRLSGQSISITVWKDSLVAHTGKTFSNRVTISNDSDQKQEIDFSLKSPSSVQLLSTIPERLIFAPKEVLRFPIKGLINNQANSQVNQVSIQASSLAGEIIKSASFQLIIEGKTQAAVSLYIPDETIIIYSNNETVHLPLRVVYNRGRPEIFSLSVTSLPEGVDLSSSQLVLPLIPGQDTSVSVPVNPIHRWAADGPYQLMATIHDEQKSVVGTVMYKLILAIDNKRFSDGASDHRGGYGASAALTRFSTNQWAEELRVWGSDSVGKGKIDFQIDYLNYGSSHIQQLQNSFVSLHTDRFTLRVGSLNDYHELSLFGQGVKVSINQPNRRWNLWAVNSNPNWLSPDRATGIGTVFSVRYDQPLARLPGSSWSFSSSYFTQATGKRVGYLNFASFQYEKPEHHSLEVMGGQSTEFTPQGPDRALTFGWVGQLNYSYRSPKVSWQLRSYFSNPVYSGLQKGAIHLFSQFVWQPSLKTTLFTRLNYLHYNQIYFTSSVDNYQHKFGNVVAEANLNHSLPRLSLNLRPYWSSQSDYSSPSSRRADAFRLALTSSYALRTSQHINVGYDIGAFYNRTAHLPHRGILSQRVTSSVTMGPFSLLGYWQKGPFYLFDLQNSQSDQIIRTSLTPTVDFTLLNHKIVGSAGLNYMYDSYFALARRIVVGRIQYNISPNLSMRFSGNGTPYSQDPQFDYSIYRLEVTKHFNQLMKKTRGRLELSFFEDTNGNGNKDSGEPWMDSLLVSINENTFLTNAKGSVIYRNIPPDTYTISAISTERLGDPVLYHEKIPVAGSATKIIPLARTFRIKGQIQCKMNAYDRQPCQFNRFAIDIQRNQQKLSSTSLLPDGSFSVHLSPGAYTLFVRDYGRQPQSTIKTVDFTVDETGKYPLFDWTIDGSIRAVEIKRFSKN